MPYAICEQHKQMAIESSSMGLDPENPLRKLITVWTKWSPEGALVLQERD